MPSSRKYLSPSTLAKLKGLHLRAKRIVEGYLAGLHRSPFRGFSIEFAEHREYAVGDDLRHLDWKVFARTDKLYLKQYEDETNLVCHLVVDASESMSYRGRNSPLSKFEYAQCLAAMIAWLVLRQQDAVGLVTFDTAIRDRVNANCHPAHFDHLIETLDDCRPTGETNIGTMLSSIAGGLSRRGVVVVLSDFFDEFDRIMNGLQLLRLKRHDVIALQVLDRDEIEFPFSRPTHFRGLEQPRSVVSDPRPIAKAFRREMGQFLGQLERGCHEQAIDFCSTCTDQQLDHTIATVLGRRSRLR